MSSGTVAAHGQADHRIRLDWGPTGAAAITDGADVAVVVDVLSFSTTLTVAVERGIEVHPFAWRDERAAAYAEQVGATLAVGRLEARDRPGLVSLSPASLAALEGPHLPERLVLPSPNGSTISAALAGAGIEVVAGCLRNADAVAALLRDRLAQGAVVAVVAAGERWPDGSLRPAVEDLWGAGALLTGLDPALMSPEAELARAAYAVLGERPLDHLLGCASGRELVGSGFEADVAVAAALAASAAVPRLLDGAFRA